MEASVRGMRETAVPIELSSMKGLEEARRPADDWTGTVSIAERKKRQNRLNQRALRRRKAEDKNIAVCFNQNEDSSPSLDLEIESGQLAHFRTHGLPPTSLATLPYTHLPSNSTSVGTKTPDQDDGAPSNLYPLQVATIAEPSANPALTNLAGAYNAYQNRARHRLALTLPYFPLSSDHLITLIQYNVYRGLIQNMLLLDVSTLVLAGDPCTSAVWASAFPNLSSSIPPSLYPTDLQMEVPHPPWIDIFPSARIRENMIRRLTGGSEEETWDEDDLCVELVGEIVEPSSPSSASPPPPPNDPNTLSIRRSSTYVEDDSTVTANRTGLILWRDPWDVNGWEITPQFLKRWGWMVDGCEDILRASNRWRAERCEVGLEELV